METTAFNLNTSPNPKEGLAFLVKTPAKLPPQTVQHGENALFADILCEKISQAALLESASDSTTAAPGNMRPLPASAKGLALDGNREPSPLAESAGEQSPFPAEKVEPTKEPETPIHLAKAMMEQVFAIPAAPESVPHADPSATENATRQIAPPDGPDTALFVQAGGTGQMKNDGPTTDGVPAKNPTTIAAPAPVASPGPDSHKNLTDAPPGTPATPTTREVPPLSAQRADYHSPMEGAKHRTEPGLMRQADETLPMKNDGPATKGPPPDERQAGPSRYDHGKRAVESNATASQKPVSAAGNGDATIGLAAPERMTPGEERVKTIPPARDAMKETPGPAHDHQHNRNTTPNHPPRFPERDMFPLRMELPNVVSPQGTNAPVTVGATGIEMQSVVDRILEARQAAGNDSGRIRILLNPPNLGSVDLDIVVRGERVAVMMTTENSTVQQALQSRSDDIRIALQRQDLKVEGFQVLVQDNGTNQQQTNSGAMYRQNREHRELFDANEDAPPDHPPFSSIAAAKSAAGLVSIFA